MLQLWSPLSFILKYEFIFSQTTIQVIIYLKIHLSIPILIYTNLQNHLYRDSFRHSPTKNLWKLRNTFTTISNISFIYDRISVFKKSDDCYLETVVYPNQGN